MGKRLGKPIHHRDMDLKCPLTCVYKLRKLLFLEKILWHKLINLKGLAGKTDLDEAKAAMIAETTEEVFMSPVFGLFSEKDKEKQVYICFPLPSHDNILF